MLIDSHCHLQDRKFDKDREDVLQRARDAGVTGFVVVGYDVASSRKAVDLADDRSDVHAVVGVHPHDAKTLTPKDIDTLDRLADSAKVVAIGEIGLDFYRNLSPREEQERAFHEQLDLARSLKLPVVIHSRNADLETYEILSRYEREAIVDWPRDKPLGIMHCFAGDVTLALRYIEIGFVISIPTTVTYPNAGRMREVAAGVPSRWMAVETDAPYLPPQSVRGKRNEPAYVTEAVSCVAKVRGVAPEEVADRTALTAAWLFGLGEIGEPSAPSRAETS
ncbi:MAG: TatD family hydrolase [Chloroflexi bacterium]|nr:TatD family hydrolase [Chloroflexota bacterium]